MIEILDDPGEATVRIANGSSLPAVELPLVENLVTDISKTRSYLHYMVQDIHKMAS